MARFPRRMQVFISSPSRELAEYNEAAKSIVHDFGLAEKSFHDPAGAGITQGAGSIFDQNRRAIEGSDVFIGMYGYGTTWRPASDEELCLRHPELLVDPDKSIMEYEYEWAKAAELDILRFLRVGQTEDALRGLEPSDRIEWFRTRIRADGVGFLTSVQAFHGQLAGELERIRPRVFLSYSRADVLQVRSLQKALRSEDIHAWRDEASIQVGHRWRDAIDHAINEMDVMVVVVSDASLKSEWVAKECQQFLKVNKLVVPYIIDRTIRDSRGYKLPSWLEPIHYIDGTSETGLRELVRQLRPILK